jgi:hypothetical protein
MLERCVPRRPLLVVGIAEELWALLPISRLCTGHAMGAGGSEWLELDNQCYLVQVQHHMAVGKLSTLHGGHRRKSLRYVDRALHIVRYA